MNKFLSSDSLHLFSNHDILAIIETHFGKRIKCPEEFYYITRSKSLISKKPRGGVAIFKRKESLLRVDSINTDFRDCVIVYFKDCDVVLAVIYIPPSNSIYYDDIYFTYIRLLFSRFRNSKLLIVGDLNCRYGNIKYKDPKISHLMNPDIIINENGRKLRKLIEENEDIILVNGLVCNGRIFVSHFTFFRCEFKSQVDILLVNNISVINSFNILNRNTLSDHCPLHISYCLEKRPSLDLINDCTKGVFNYDHFDVNKRVKIPIRWRNVDVVETIKELDEKANEIMIKLNDDGQDETVKLI